MLHSINCENVLDCHFSEKVDFACTCELYGCFVKSIAIEDHSGLTYDRFTGDHIKKKDTSDVKHLSIRESTVNFLPRRLDLLFNLTSFLVLRCSLVSIESDDFIGLENLKFLNLADNYLTVLPNDVFSRLPYLKRLILRENHIIEIPSGLFKDNLELEEVWLYNNRIKFINPNNFMDLKKLNFVDLLTNKCLSKRYDGFHLIPYLIEDSKLCENLYEPSQNTIERLKEDLKEISKERKILLNLSTEACDINENKRFVSKKSNVSNAEIARVIEKYDL